MGLHGESIFSPDITMGGRPLPEIVWENFIDVKPDEHRHETICALSDYVSSLFLILV